MRVIAVVIIICFLSPLFGQESPVDKGFEITREILDAVQDMDTAKVKAYYHKDALKKLKTKALIKVMVQCVQVFKQYGGIDSSDIIYKKRNFQHALKSKITEHNFIYQYPMKTEASRKAGHQIIFTYQDLKDLQKIFSIEVIDVGKAKKPARKKRPAKKSKKKKKKKGIDS
ncbi:MAG: hypothetical protein HQK83_13760 [Fibrobacteria bacterium]|nr:hypothetical protein [Fibrobacteria bacterium]